jgi:hypothetical protein
LPEPVHKPQRSVIQFFFPFGISLFGGHFFCQVGIPFGVGDGGIDGNQDGFVEVFLLLMLIMVVRLVYLGLIIFNFFGGYSFQAFMQYLFIVRHLVADIAVHLPIGNGRNMRAGSGACESMFFQVVV